MKSWTAILESLHSAFIDEMTERRSEPKPELGMPKVKTSMECPAQGTGHFHVASAEVMTASGLSRGAVLLCWDADFFRAHGGSQSEFWDGVLKRASVEFSRRSIGPKISKFQEVTAENLKTYHPSRVIWYPFSVPEGRCFLGVAV